MRTSKAGIDLIKQFEGCRLSAYYDSVNVATIGFGHTAGVRIGTSITQETADRLLAEDLQEFERYVNNYVKVPLTQCQFDALVSFTYNLGPGTLSRSTLLKQLNAGDHDAAARSILLFDKAGGVKLKGLTRRRLAEQQMFVTPEVIAGDDPNLMTRLNELLGRKA